MRVRTLIREAITAARSSPIPAVLVALVVGAMCFTSVATVGRQAAVEAAVAAELAGPDARLLTVTNTGNSTGLTTQAVAVLSTLNDADAVIGSSLPVDAFNGQLGQGASPVAVVGLHGKHDAAIQITRGRPPDSGEVVVPQAMLRTLGLEHPVGYLESADGTQWAIVGAFEPRPPFDDLATMAVTLPDEQSSNLEETSLHQIQVVADSVNTVRAVQNGTLSVISADPTQVQVNSAVAAAGTSQAVSGELAGFGRSLLLLILGAGAFFVAIVVLADVLIRRRDLGRRRTLGITRGNLVALVMLRTCVPAVIGALLGTLAGHIAVSGDAGEVPVTFTLAVVILGTLTAAAACLAPAVFASRRDPVEVMRTA